MPASKGAAGFCWQAVERALERARGANALRDIPTVPRRHGKFVLRLSENLRQKPKLEEASGVGPISRPKRLDPFERNNLDPDLVVCDLGSGHTVLLNKFPVVSPHLLVVTRDFEPQTDLSAADYRACLSVLGQWRGEDGGLAFYNSGPHSGMR
ncbi:hypothetical protein HKI87_09g56260 [Chloropicon roscoffensis]|uniref:Ap4A phosphorylase 1/2 N-terminal domain-containing protein n=1 Tax=Chloropicon roscoffensis TaxID=1461544 RepID=A0AAX4PCK2_9CHLO